MRLKIEKQSSKTKVVYNSNDPVWNEVIAFDIATGTDDLVLTVENVDGNEKEVIGEHQIDLKSLSRREARASTIDPLVGAPAGGENEIDQMKKDSLYDLGQGAG